MKSPWPRFKLQALQKIHGTWRAAEDWPGETVEGATAATRRDERIEELVLVFSHSHAGTEPFLNDGPSVVELLTDSESGPKLTISNASCMPWRGTSSVVQRNPFGGVATYVANVTYKLYVPDGEDPEDVENQPVRLYVVEQGTVSAERNWPDAIGCVQSVALVSGTIAENDSRIAFDFINGTASGGGISTIPGGTHRLECPGSDPIVASGPVPAQWLNLGMTGAAIGQDGRTLRGGFTETEPMSGVTTENTWNLSALPEE